MGSDITDKFTIQWVYYKNSYYQGRCAIYIWNEMKWKIDRGRPPTWDPQTDSEKGTQSGAESPTDSIWHPNLIYKYENVKP